jgi:hypothetical protein
MALTLSHDSGVDAGAKFVREFAELGVPINLDGALSGVANDVTVVTPLQMFLELGLGMRVYGVIEVIGQLF